MKAMRADMGGAATVVSSALAIAKLQLPYVIFVTIALLKRKLTTIFAALTSSSPAL